MAFQYKQLSTLSAVTTAGTTMPIYTNPSGTSGYVRQIWLHAPIQGMTNFSKTSVSLFRVPNTAGGVGHARPTQAFFTRSLVTNETYLLDCGVPGIKFESANDTLQLWHLSQTTVNFMVTGGKET